MMTPQRLQRLAGLLATHGLAGLSWCEGSNEIHMSRTNRDIDPVTAGEAPVPETLRAPFAGTLLWQHPCDEGPLPAAGHELAAGEIVAWIAVGPLLRPVRIERAARLVRRESPTDSLVGWGQALALLAPHSKD